MPEVAQGAGDSTHNDILFMADEDFSLLWPRISPELLAELSDIERSQCDERARRLRFKVVERVPEEDQSVHEAVRSLLELDHGEPPTDDGPPPEVVLETRSEAWMRVPAQPATEEWPEPVDFWEHSTLPSVKAEYLPAALADFCLDQAEIVGTDPVQQCGFALALCAASIRESISLQMMAQDTRWQERARIWVAVVGEPSTGKKPAFDSVAGYWEHLAKELHDSQEHEFAEYREASKVYEYAIETWRRGEAKAPGSVPRPEAPIKPLSKRLWTDNVTVEKVADLLASHSRGKIACIKDELAGWFAFDCYSANGSQGKDRAEWLTAFEGKSRYVDRMTEGRSIYVPSFSVVLMGGIQNSVLATIQNKLSHDGMLQRFQILNAKPANEGIERKADVKAVERWKSMLRHLIDIEAGVSPVRFSDDAQEYRSDCAKWVFKNTKGCQNPALASWLGKQTGALGRVSLIFHCVNCADVGRQIPDAEIPLETIASAWQWIYRILWPNAVAFFEHINVDSSGESMVARVAGRILMHKYQSFNAGTLCSAYKTFQDLPPAQRQEVLSQLELSGWIRREGRYSPVTRELTKCVVNPSVHDGRFEAERKKYDATRIAYKGMFDQRKAARAASREPGEE